MAVVSPSSPAAMSDVDMSSSPAGVEKSFMTHYTEDEDTKMLDVTPDSAEKVGRGSRGRGGQGSQSGSQVGKIRHLKKDDGEPLWRKDIQYDFLKAVFDNDQAVFTNSYETKIGKQTFADLYIDTMSRSSKTSKVLRDKLLSDREAAKGMAMVCLLVNIGRMNTTLNCTHSLSHDQTSMPQAQADTTFCPSLPRDASTASHVPCDPLATGASRSARL